MALSKCPNSNCKSLINSKGSSFEMATTNFGSKSKYFFVQCTDCGTVVGIINEYSHNHIMNKIRNTPHEQSGLTMLQDSDNFDAIMELLNNHSSAIIAIMKKLGIEV